MDTRRGFLRAAAVTGGALVGAAAATGGIAEAAKPKHVKVVHEHWLTKRLVQISVASPAMGKTMKVRLLVPHGWSRHASRTWPAVWLLHGGLSDQSAWTVNTDIAHLSAKHQVLVVMPDGGTAGGYTNWWNFGNGGPPGWEAFHLHELLPLLTHHYRAGKRRTVAGNSTGGFGALIYAARHPGMFRFAASYSGFCSTLSQGVPQILMTGLNGLRPKVNQHAMWGDPVRDKHIWAAHDPLAQAGHLRGTGLWVSCSKHGERGALDPHGPAVDPLEQSIWYTTQPFLARLRQLHIPVHTHLYAKGTHTWPYWQDGLHRSWPLMMKALRTG